MCGSFNAQKNQTVQWCIFFLYLQQHKSIIQSSSCYFFLPAVSLCIILGRYPSVQTVIEPCQIDDPYNLFVMDGTEKDRQADGYVRCMGSFNQLWIE